MKPKLPLVTLVSVDTTTKAHLASRAIAKSIEECEFGAVKLLTDDLSQPRAVKIPKLNGLAAYSNFVIKQLHRYIDTEYCLIVQHDGYVVNGSAWNSEFLSCDYIGAPFQPTNIVGNGGFSLRSKRLLERYAGYEYDVHPEDAFLCLNQREQLKSEGFKFASPSLASKFAFEGRSWDSKEWKGIPNKWNGSFGFHSFLSAGVPGFPHIATHSGDAGDIIYGMAVFKAFGGGALFITPHNRYPYPLPTRWSRMGGEAEFVDNIAPLLLAQPYVWSVKYTHGHPTSCSLDLNKFREPWKNRTASDFDSIIGLHRKAFGVSAAECPDNEPWLTVPDPIVIPGRPIIVNRTARYQNDKVRWDLAVEKYGHLMAFVGSRQEAELFQGFAPQVKIHYAATSNLLDAARVIAGGKVFLGNQSACQAIAHGLGKRVISECWMLNQNCNLERGEDGIYITAGEIKIPESWLV